MDPRCHVAGNDAFERQPMSKADQGVIADDFTQEPLKERPGACTGELVAGDVAVARYVAASVSFV